MSREPGEVVLGRYQIHKRLSESQGMSQVYLCFDLTIDKMVVLKEIDRHNAGRMNINYEAILNEARILNTLNHPGIPRIITMEGVNPPEDHVSIVMDHVEGFDLTRVMKERRHTFGESMAVNRMLDVARILEYLHSKDILYRDLKPSNIIITETSTSLLDFGISVAGASRVSSLGPALGTKGFLAPEQALANAKADLRIDIFSFGAVLFHLLTGVIPDDIPKDFDFNILNYPAGSGMSTGLAKIILQCTQVNPEYRYQSFDEVINDLENYHALDTSYQKSLKRKRGIIFTAAVLSVLSAIGGAGVLYYANRDLANQYTSKIANANLSGNPDDFVDALKMNPTDVKAYDGFLKTIQSDGVFTPEEEAKLLSVIQPSLSDIKKADGYPELAFNLGKTYWYFYEGNSSGEVLSDPWFMEVVEDTRTSDDLRSEAQVYSNLSQFTTNINSAVKTSSDSGMYLQYWNNLLESKSSAKGEVVELQTYNRIVDALVNYAYRLKVDGVSRTELDAELSNVVKYAESVTPTSEVSVNLHQRLRDKLSRAKSAVESAYDVLGDSGTSEKGSN